MTDVFITDSTIVSLYELDTSKSFDEQFSVVSPESILFFCIAFGIQVFEKIMDVFRSETQAKVDAAYIANEAWWHAMSKAFQKGYSLVMDATTFVFRYETIDEAARIIKRVAVRESVAADGVCKVKLYIATESNSEISPVTDTDKGLFENYVSRIKPSGVLVTVITGDGDTVDLGVTIDFNPLILDSTGLSILNANYPVNEAIALFIDNLNDNDFGGKLNVTRLIDAIQNVDGVVDVNITALTIAGTVKQTWGTYESSHGWFKLGTITPTYQPHI